MTPHCDPEQDDDALVGKRQANTDGRSDQLLWQLLHNPNTYPPTVEELRVALGWSSKSLVHRYLRLLERQGKVRVDRWEPRGVHLTLNLGSPVPD